MDKLRSNVSLKTNSTPTSPVMLFSILFYFSPLLLMFFMLGSGIMAGTPFVFLFYLLIVFLVLMFRHLLWWMFKAADQCKETVYLPFIFHNYKDFMSTFLFFFTIVYVFGPFFNWKQANESSAIMFVFLIFYAIYDLVMRIYFTKCPTLTRSNIFAGFGNIVLGGFFGGLAQWGMSSLGLSKYLYYSNSVNRPTKKIFKCGKIKSQ
jgi:hypothetical protein